RGGAARCTSRVTLRQPGRSIDPARDRRHPPVRRRGGAMVLRDGSRAGAALVLSMQLLALGWAGRAAAQTPLKLEVVPSPKVPAVGESVTLEVRVKGSDNRLTPLTESSDVELSISAGSGESETRKLHLRTGESFAVSRWRPAVPGLVQLTVKES